MSNIDVTFKTEFEHLLKELATYIAAKVRETCGLRAERDAALAELAAIKKRLADSPIGAVEVYEAQRYVGGKRVAVKLPESFEHGAVVRVVRVLTEDMK